jgi:hypothetical protein
MNMEKFPSNIGSQEQLNAKSASELQVGDFVTEYGEKLKNSRNAGSSQEIILTFESGFEVKVDRDEDFTVHSA